MRNIDTTRLGKTLTKVLGLLALGFVMLVGAQSSEARLHPYYVVKGAGFGQIAPRILFVLDTSGSMAWRATQNPQDCTWNNCETAAGSSQSRIAAARKALKQVVIETADQAKFGFMTFEQHKPPVTRPKRCHNSSSDRFEWVDTYYYISWQWLNMYPGYNGHWILCDSDINYPYPYLRWDNLGVRTPAQQAQTNSKKAVTPLPASPLISTASGDMYTSYNQDRKVQWFPQFMGVRFNADCTNDWEVIKDSKGDYSTQANSMTPVCGHDFYYWPYVDGFPGYSAVYGTRYSSCGNNGCDWHYQGVVGQDNAVNAAQLYGPFYLELDPNDVNPNYWGPADEDEADAMLLNHLSPLIEGGVDVSGGTPWDAVIGTIPAAPLKNNAIFSHSTVGSYLKFVTNATTADACAPTAAVLVTDGEPNCWQTNQNSSDCARLFGRLSDLRRELDVKVYVVGFFVTSAVLNDMACAAAGTCQCAGANCCSNPCNGTPSKQWDTCSDPQSGGSTCAFLANSPEQLVKVLTDIVNGLVETDVSSGPGATVNDFGVSSGGNPGEGEQLQTKLNAWTEWPAWKGHVTREMCDDLDVYDLDEDLDYAELAPYCVAPTPEFETAELEPTFGPCPQSRAWDAGECLQQTDWADRRLYSHDSSNNVYRITNAGGNAEPKFVAELQSQGLIAGANMQQQADDIAAFLLGKNWPDDWKLPGLANSAPIVVRRVPEHNENYLPSVPIRDPHCAGRFLDTTSNADIPQELIKFAQNAWDESLQIQAPSPHYEYQEAVIIGDDLGVVHAFQWNSGNELFGFVPRFALESVKRQFDIGPKDKGQPSDLDDHNFGVSATMNHGWVYDKSITDFRHVGVIGMGIGGTEYMALDLTHMSPNSPKLPIEVLWTTEDPGLKATYDTYNGETWARPAITYEVDNDNLTELPTSQVVMGTGYQTGGVSPAKTQGRVLMVADALDGTLVETATVPAPITPVYEANYGTVVDTAVGSHCISRFWAEKQETYIADPAGRLFRWDLGRDTNHESDSGGKWNGAAQDIGTRFPACSGTGAACNVSANNKGDVFEWAPAVTSINRIDTNTSGGFDQQNADQFMIALASGSPYDDTLDWSVKDNDFHSSLYLLVDDHQGNKKAGFTIPAGAPKMSPGSIGTDANYLRLAVSDIERQRVFTPFPGSPEYTETDEFSRRARPIRAPRIKVSGVSDGGALPVEGVEVMEIEYTIFEPGPGECDPRFYDKANDKWYYDEGSTYTYRLRLTVDETAGFDFTNGAKNFDFDSITSKGLTATGPNGGQAEQIRDGECADGICGPKPGDGQNIPCDNNDPQNSSGDIISLPVNRAELVGFTPLE